MWLRGSVVEGEDEGVGGRIWKVEARRFDEGRGGRVMGIAGGKQCRKCFKKFCIGSEQDKVHVCLLWRYGV